MRRFGFFILVLLLAGCESYQLRGKVLPGFASSVHVVDQNSPDLEREGLAGVRVEAIIDPDRLDRTRIAPVMTAADGSFAIPVDSPGAGVLEYDVLVVAQFKGHKPAEAIFRLPAGSKRLVIEMTEGSDHYQSKYFDYLGDTKRLGEPYMGGK